MIRGFLSGLLMAIVLTVIYLIIHLGLLQPVTIKEEVRGPFHILFRSHQGAYYQISEIIMKVEAQAKENSLDCDQTFGEFFDNPKEVDEDRLRSRAGCISRAPFPQIPDGDDVDQIPEQRYVVAEFSGSPAIGPIKVYPKVQEYAEAHRLHRTEEAIEIYTAKNGSFETIYLFPLK
jgi:effector-binding domain-containing protein